MWDVGRVWDVCGLPKEEIAKLHISHEKSAVMSLGMTEASFSLLFTQKVFNGPIEFFTSRTTLKHFTLF